VGSLSTGGLVTRPLRYPGQAGEKPQEKGIDVALALDFVAMAMRGEYEVGILMSTDTDLKPALELVAQMTTGPGIGGGRARDA
jgi:uncharacterized LabA/DUF88 family protein